ASLESHAATSAVPLANIYRRKRSNIPALWRARRDAVFSAAQFDSSPALLRHRSWRGFPAVCPNYLSPFALGGRAGRKVRAENSAGYRPVNLCSRLRAFHVANCERILLAELFSCCRCTWDRNGCNCCAAYDHCDEFG